MGIIGEEIKPDKKAIVYPKGKSPYTNLYDIARQVQKRESPREIEINGKKYRKSIEPTVKDLRKMLGLDK